MRRHLEALHLGHLQLDVGVDHVVRHDAALLEELAILREAVERLAQAAAHRRDLRQLVRRQIVEVLVHRLAGMELVLNTVEASHQHRREAEVGVRRRIGEADLDALGLRARHVRNAARCRAVAGRVSEQHRRFEARNQPLVGVGQRVGEGIDGLGVLEDAGDVAEARVGEVGVLVAGEHRLAVFPDRLVAVHARTVVAEDRLRHEARGLAVGGSHLMDHVLVDLHVVGERDHRPELDAEFMLRGGDLVMVLLDDDAHLRHDREHLGADVLAAVDRRYREVAALGARTVAEVAHLVLGAGVRRQFRAVELEARVVGIRVEAHVVEDEELGFGAEHHAVADAGLLHVGFGALGDGARITLVHLARRRLEHVAENRDGGLREEGVDMRRCRIRHQRHVGRLDALPARDRGPVEGIAVREHGFVDARGVGGHVLHLALGIGEPQVQELDVLVLHDLQNVCS